MEENQYLQRYWLTIFQNDKWQFTDRGNTLKLFEPYGIVGQNGLILLITHDLTDTKLKKHLNSLQWKCRTPKTILKTTWEKRNMIYKEMKIRLTSIFQQQKKESKWQWNKILKYWEKELPT